MSFPLPSQIELKKNKEFLVKGVNFATGIEFVAVADAETREALIQNKPFPKETRLVDVKVQGEAGKDLAFLGKGGNVHFKAGAFAGLGVYLSPEKLIKDLKLSDEIDDGFELPGSLNEYLLALRWGYDADAKAQGSIALGAGGSLTFSAEAQRDAAYAVVRRFPRDTNSHTSVEELANSWILPTHFETIADLEPGTWLFAEVNGSVAANIGITYGLDFNWVRELKEGGLVGDIGLKLQLGLEASLGFNASGKYAVIMCRESLDPAQENVRLRIFKQRKKGWDFALSAGATVEGQLPLKPDSYDDLIKAAFGMHGAQIVKGLKTFDKWTDSEAGTLPEILAGAGLDEARKLLAAVTGKDPVAEFDAAKQKVLDFLGEWTSLDKLNHRVSTLIWKVIGEIKVEADLDKELAAIAEIAGKIENLDLDGVKELLEERLKEVDFFRTPVGKWLEALAGEGILRALSGNDEFQKLQEAAAATKRLLDGGPIQDVLKKLQDYIEKALGDELKRLEQITTAITDADFKSLKKWFAARLADFLNDKLDLAKLEQIRKSLRMIRTKSQKYYEAGVKALTRKYKFNYSYTYNSATTKTALLDVVFDLSKVSTDTWLSQSVDGEFKELLLRKHDGVTLNTAHLTHQIERNSHAVISTPFYGKDTVHSNKSFADFTPVEEDGKILNTYSLDAKDIVEVKNRLMSQLAIGGFWDPRKNNKVVQHSTAGLSYSYSFRQVKQNMIRSDLKYQLQPYVDQYFKRAFSSQGNGVTSGTFDAWLTNLEDNVEPSLRNGPDRFGDTLLSLELSVPASVTSAWLDAPRDEKSDLYMNMSIRMQESLKYLVPYLYFQNPKTFKTESVAAGILVYAALEPSTRITGNFPDFRFDTRTGVYWDHRNPSFYEFMLNRKETAQRLYGILQRIQSRFNNNPEFKSLAENYAPERYGVFLGYARNHSGSITNLKALLDFESTVINGARDAGVQIAKFKEDAANEPEKAIEALAKFGAKVTETFNGPISSMHGGDKSRPMSTLLFIEAAKALKPSQPDEFPTALLELIVLKDNAPFKSKLASYIANELPGKDETLVEQHLVSLLQ